MLRASVLKRFLRKKLRRYFFAGLLVMVPGGLTIVVVRWIVSLMDGLPQPIVWCFPAYL